MEERKRITVSQIIADLDSGLTRTQIKEKYNLTGPDMKLIFNHPKIKGRRPKRVTVDFIDDTEGDTAPNILSEYKEAVKGEEDLFSTQPAIDELIEAKKAIDSAENELPIDPNSGQNLSDIY